MKRIQHEAKRCYLSLGSNLDGPRFQVKEAIRQIQTSPNITLIKASSYYQTSPVGPICQPDFINAIIALDTTLLPEQLLEICLMIEKNQGRLRRERFGPRVIDIDIIAIENTPYHSDSLTLPHARMHERLFVLIPLAEIAPNFKLSHTLTVKQQIQTLLTAQPQQVIKRIEEPSHVD